MHVTRLWDRTLDSPRLYREGAILMVLEEESWNYGMSGCHARSFDLRTREPFGPVFTLPERVCLADVPERWPVPVLASVKSETLVVKDARNGRPVERIPLPERECRSLSDAALTRIDGRTVLYLLENPNRHDHGWTVVGLDPSEPFLAWENWFPMYREHQERMSLGGEWLAVPDEEYVVWCVEYTAHDPAFVPEHLPEPRVGVYRASDGARTGKVEPEAGTAVVATVGGHSYLAQEQSVLCLPELTPVVRVPLSVGVALAAWEGRPVAVFAQKKEDPPSAAGRVPPIRLVYCFLDVPENTDGAEPELVAIPWEIPGGFCDLLAGLDGEVVVATSEGVYVVTVDL